MAANLAEVGTATEPAGAAMPPVPLPAGTLNTGPKQAIQKVHYTHDAIIDTILANPALNQGELARSVGYTQGWLSRVMASDAFKDRLAARKKELIDPAIVLNIEEKLAAVAQRSMDVVLDKLEVNPTAEFAGKMMEMSTKALGYGARPMGGAAAPVQLNQQIVIVPGKANSAEEWAKAHAPKVEIEVPVAALPAK